MSDKGQEDRAPDKALKTVFRMFVDIEKRQHAYETENRNLKARLYELEEKVTMTTQSLDHAVKTIAKHRIDAEEHVEEIRKLKNSFAECRNEKCGFYSIPSDQPAPPPQAKLLKGVTYSILVTGGTALSILLVRLVVWGYAKMVHGVDFDIIDYIHGDR